MLTHHKLITDMQRTLTLFALLSFTAATVLAEEPTRYMVVTKRAPKSTSLRVVTNAADSVERRVREFRNIDGFAATLTAEEAAALRKSPDVESVQPVVPRNALDLGVELPVRPSASPYAKQVVPWGIQAVGAPAVWEVTRGEGVNVVTVDSGIVLDHPDLIARYQGGYNWVDPTKPPFDEHGHGTHVAGTIVASDNAFGVVGVAPGAKLWAVRVLNEHGYGNDEAVTGAIDWVISKKRELGGRWVVNMSIGSYFASDAEAKIMARAADEGIVLVAAAGNDHSEEVMFPAKHPEVIGVSALDPTLLPASYTNYGLDVDVAGPGTDVPSTYLQGKVPYADIETANGLVQSFSVTGSGRGTVQARVVDCKYGRPGDCPFTVAGHIALVERGPSNAPIYFGEKARNAKAAGAAGVILYNNTSDISSQLSDWTLIFDDKPFDYPVTVSVSRDNGLKLLQNPHATIKLTSVLEDYGKLSGTSMACPHVVGTAALLLALDPNATRTEIKRALEQSAKDVDKNGWDLQTGWGLVNALAAGKFIAPELFNTTPPPPTKRRSVR